MAHSRRLFVAVPCFPATFTDPVARGLPVVTAIDDAFLAPSVSLALFRSPSGPVFTVLLAAPRSFPPSCKKSDRTSRSCSFWILHREIDIPAVVLLTSVLRAKLRAPLRGSCATFLCADFPASTSYAKTSRSDLVVTPISAARGPRHNTLRISSWSLFFFFAKKRRIYRDIVRTMKYYVIDNLSTNLLQFIRTR